MTDREKFEAWYESSTDGVAMGPARKSLMWKCWQASRKQAMEEAAQEFDRRDNGGGFYDPHEPAEIIRALANPEGEQG